MNQTSNHTIDPCVKKILDILQQVVRQLNSETSRFHVLVSVLREEEIDHYATASVGFITEESNPGKIMVLHKLSLDAIRDAHNSLVESFDNQGDLH